MPFMDEDSTDSDGSSQNLGSSPQSTTTNATSVGTNHDSNGCRKRKRKAMDVLPRKRCRMDPCFNERALPVDGPLGTTTTGMPCMPRKNQGNELLERLALSDAEECASFPTSVWKSIFVYLPPRSLGTLLSVNSMFYRLLTGSSPKLGGGPFAQDTVHKDAERIWRMARQRHHPHLPRPLHGYRELDMWRLIGATQCQFCVQSLGSPLQSSNYLVGNHLTYQGPTRAEIYWPLAVRSCQRCLGRQFSTETELRSSKLSYLIPCMNYAFVKDSSSSMDLRAVPTPGSKIYLRSHMEWLHAETLRITHKTNSANAEVWLKTYEINAQKRQRDAMRWERWEASNGRVKLFPKSVKATSRRHMTSGGSSPASTCRSSPTPRAEPVTLAVQHQTIVRLQDLARRASELVPPIPLNILKHTSAYQDAQHIPRPLDELEWSTLRLQLETQRPQAEILAQAELSDRLSSPQSSDGSTMSKSKKRRSREARLQRMRENANSASLSTTGAIAVPIGESKLPLAVPRPAAVVPTSSAPPIATTPHTVFNQQIQRAPSTTGQPYSCLGAPVQQIQSWRAAGSEPSTAAPKMGAPYNVIGPVPELTQVPTTTANKPLSVAVAIKPTASRSIEPELYKSSEPENRNQQSYQSETKAVCQSEPKHRPWLGAVQYHDHPRPRCRSRSPSGEQRRLVNPYRERDYQGHGRHILAAYPSTTLAHVAPIRGGHDDFYNYPVPVSRHVPNVLYDEYGNEYVRTAPRELNPYVLYPPPHSRGY